MSYVCLQCEYECKPATQLKYFQVVTDSINAERNARRSCCLYHCVCSQRLVRCMRDYSSEGALKRCTQLILLPLSWHPGAVVLLHQFGLGGHS